jgi:hypothetical protein
MSIVTVYHNPNGVKWEQVEQYNSRLSIEDIADQYDLVSLNHGVEIEGNTILVGESLKVVVE